MKLNMIQNPLTVALIMMTNYILKPLIKSIKNL
jgi:hypothetical protein